MGETHKAPEYDGQICNTRVFGTDNRKPDKMPQWGLSYFVLIWRNRMTVVKTDRSRITKAEKKRMPNSCLKILKGDLKEDGRILKWFLKK